jgi:DNA-binding LytR/AlgR family response regulator
MNTSIIKIGGCQRVPANEVVMFQAVVNYTIVHFANGKKLLVASTMKELEERLKAQSFYRIHKRYMVNMGWVERFCRHDNIIYLSNNQHIEVARRRLPSFKKYWAAGSFK